LILHILRGYLGDEAFFEGFKHYLTRHQFGSAEAHDLRLAFEAVTGEDLNWFFNQWFFDKGHPIIEAKSSFSDSTKILSLDIKQIQDSSLHRPVFQFPLEYRLIFEDGSTQDEVLWVNNRSVEYDLPCERSPRVVLFNQNQSLLCELKTQYNTADWAFIFDHSPHVVTSYKALNEIKYIEDYSDKVIKALDHGYWQIRSVAVQNLPSPVENDLLTKLKDMLVNDKRSLVRSRILRILDRQRTLDEHMIIERLEQDSSASVIAFTLDWLQNNDHPDAEKYAARYLDNYSKSIGVVVASILSETGDRKYIDYFESRIFKGRIFLNAHLLTSYSNLLKSLPTQYVLKRCTWLNNQLIQLDSPSYIKSYYYRVIQEQVENLEGRGLENDAELNKSIQSLKSMLKA